MPVFYRQAYEAACRGVVPPRICDEDFETWERLEPVLALLPTDEQRCDAVYGNWLMRLHNPGGRQLLEQRAHLIGDGALDANYLAELAQNANDAAGGEGAELRVALHGDWLLVANNGRKVSPLNLNGLCDFFGHFAPPVMGIRTIGRFGVGFKSSFRIADEILIVSWDSDSGEFCFRLPISRPDRPPSFPDGDTASRVIRQLGEVGVRVAASLVSPEIGGYCTPEARAHLPTDVPGVEAMRRDFERGTLFCFHICPSVRAEVETRIHEQEHRIYELCPLFLPALNVVRIGDCQLRLIRHRSVDQDDERIIAERVTLQFSRVGSRSSCTRFWRFRGCGPDDKWQLALHASEQGGAFLLRTERDQDEEYTSVRDGAAYVFFPLSGVPWPLRLHLHLDLSPNLARSDWNHGDGLASPQSQAVIRQVQSAIDAFGSWLESHPEFRHPQWEVNHIFERKPTNDEVWAKALWDAVSEQTRVRRVVRTVWGSWCTSEVRSVRLVPQKEARQAWKELGDLIPALPIRHPLTAHEEPSVCASRPLESWESEEIFRSIACNAETPAEVRIALVQAFLSIQNQTIGAMEAVLGAIPVDLAYGGTESFESLCQALGGAELTPPWHETIRKIAVWGSDALWRTSSVFGQPLVKKLQQLSQPTFNPAWSEIPSRLSTAEQWTAQGELFWRAPRNPCPNGLRSVVLASLRVPIASGEWILLSGTWIYAPNPPICFAGILNAWGAPGAGQVRQKFISALDDWKLLPIWEEMAAAELKKHLSGRYLLELRRLRDRDALGLTFGQGHRSSRDGLDDAWRMIVDDAERSAIAQFCRIEIGQGDFKDCTLLTPDIPEPQRAAACLLPTYRRAPAWLTDSALAKIPESHLAGECAVRVLGLQGFRHNEVHIVRDILEAFHRWGSAEVPEDARVGLERLCRQVPQTHLKSWVVGLSPQRRRTLREFFVKTPCKASPTAREVLMEFLLAKAIWHADPLPEVLCRVPSIVSACTSAQGLQLQPPETLEGPLSELNRDQIPESLREVAAPLGLLENPDQRVYGSPEPLHLRWLRDGDVVASLPDAPFVFVENRLVCHAYLPPADADQFERVLHVYETHATPSIAYKGDASLDAYTRYQRHRIAIRDSLLKELVTKVGYNRQHIFRELLQNAESAYASKADPPAEPWFEFAVKSSTPPPWRTVVASHAGRGFNEKDRDGRERADVDRIWRLAAESERMADEVGRYNRGFKVLFTVARDGVVRIRSGCYDFEVIDLLILRPREPKPTALPAQVHTEFTFSASAEDARGMLHLGLTIGQNDYLRLINPSSLVFLQYIRRVSVKFDGHHWQWYRMSERDGAGWERVSIREGAGRASEVFSVFRGDSQNVSTPGELSRRFAVAVRMGADGLPTPLEKEWKVFRLTFETDRSFPLDFLVNGDFDADQGRIDIRNITRSGLVDLAYRAVLERAQAEIVRTCSRTVWIRWARIFHLRDASTELEGAFHDEGKRFQRIAKQASEFFEAHVPHQEALVAAGELVFPSDLLRKIEPQFGSAWGLDSTGWIDGEIARILPEGANPKTTLHGWLNGIPAGAPVLQRIGSDFQSAAFAEIRPSASEGPELREARKVLEEKLRPVVPPFDPVPLRVEPEPWSLADLDAWWSSERAAINEYTLDGANWALLFPGDQTPGPERRLKLRTALGSSGGHADRGVWYRVLGLACLMSGAGHGRIESLRRFWQSELDRRDRDFWNKTLEGDFERVTTPIFQGLVTRTALPGGSGEAADYWRHVFYDLRKVHELIQKHEFLDTIQALLTDPLRVGQLPQFLKDGRLPGQQPWAGVLGQSAGVPLFFLTRELCRLEVTSSAELRRLAFFVCTPVRRAAERIGWLTPAEVGRTDFQSLARLSEKLHDKIAADPRRGRLLADFDIPLLHFGLTR